MTQDLVHAVRAALTPLADPQRAAGMSAYMRGQFNFFGVPTPVRREVTRSVVRHPPSGQSLLESARALWALDQREYQYVALDLMVRQVAHLGPAHLDELLALVRRKSWWDTVDGLAGVVGRILRAARRSDPDVQRHMDVALGDENLWVRRVAMLHQLGWKTETDQDRLFGYALDLASERDFFIRKAIGWALRDYARHDPVAVRAFLDRSDDALSALSRREAAKHLDRR